MTEPASTLAAGSVGTVETQYLDLPEPVRLDCGRALYPVPAAEMIANIAALEAIFRSAASGTVEPV